MIYPRQRKPTAARRSCRAQRPDDLLAKAPSSVDPCNHGQPLNALVAIGIEEGVVIAERHAAVGIAVGAEHVGMREQAGSAVYRLLAANGIEPQRRHAVE